MGAARVNRSIGRVTGFKIAPAPLEGSLNRELGLLLEGFGIDHVLDVCGHVGHFALSLRKGLDYAGAITSFEPAPDSFRALETASANDPNWSVVNSALGSKEGSALGCSGTATRAPSKGKAH